MKKEIWITAYKPDYSFPSAYESYDKARQYMREDQALLKVLVDTPDPDQIVEATEV